MTRAALKTGVATAFHFTGADRIARSRRALADTPAVAYFHRIVPEPNAVPGGNRSMLLSAASFEWILDELARTYELVPLADLASGTGGPAPALALTFDDGYLDFYEHAFPVLSRKGIPATVFVITDGIGTLEPPFHDRLLDRVRRWWPLQRRGGGAGVLEQVGVDPAVIEEIAGDDAFAAFRALWTTLDRSRLEPLLRGLTEVVGSDPDVERAHRLMDWDHLVRLREAGFGIGSHTRTHPVLTNEPLARVRDELCGSRVALERRLGGRVDAVSYPDGAYDDVVVREAVAAGYRHGLTTCGCRDGSNPRLTLPRRHFWEAEVRDAFGRRSPAMVHARLAGILDFPRRCRATHQASASASERVSRKLAEDL